MAQTDQWFAEDKYKHFAVSAAIASVATVATGDKHIGFWSSVGVGVAKELHDQQASAKDLAWDVLGAYIGAELPGWALHVNGDYATVIYKKDF